MDILEKDWTLFRTKLPVWQESYMSKLNKEYIDLLSSDKQASEKFWALEKRIKIDKRKAGVCVEEMSRSQMLFNILELLQDEAIKPDDLDGFSEGLKEKLKLWYKRSRQRR